MTAGGDGTPETNPGTTAVTPGSTGSRTRRSRTRRGPRRNPRSRNPRDPLDTPELRDALARAAAAEAAMDRLTQQLSQSIAASNAVQASAATETPQAAINAVQASAATETPQDPSQHEESRSGTSSDGTAVRRIATQVDQLERTWASSVPSPGGVPRVEQPPPPVTANEMSFMEEHLPQWGDDGSSFHIVFLRGLLQMPEADLQRLRFACVTLVLCSTLQLLLFLNKNVRDIKGIGFCERSCLGLLVVVEMALSVDRRT